MKPLVIGRRPGAGDQGYLWMLRLQHLGKALVTFDILRAPLFVANANHLQVEGRRMPHRGAFPPPDAGGSGIGKFNQVEGVLYVMVEVVKWSQFAGIELASHAAIENRQGFGSNVFAEQKIFVIPEAE